MYRLLFLANLIRRDFINIKCRYNLQELVQVHHIIPLEWKDHSNLFDYDVYSGYNLMFLPTRKGKEVINTMRRIHDGGHRKYNMFVKEQLDLECDPYELSYYLRHKLINNEELPW